MNEPTPRSHLDSTIIPLADLRVLAVATRQAAVQAHQKSAETRRRLVLCAGARRKLASLAEMSYPFEACGLLLGVDDGSVVRVQAVLQARNLASHRPAERYHLDPQDFLAADRQAREAGQDVVGIWHSHPNHPAVPSAADRETAWRGYSYLILGVDPLGQVRFRSWRLGDQGFVEEELAAPEEMTWPIDRASLTGGSP